MIGRMHHVVIDCPDPVVLADFYSIVLGLPVTYQSADWVVIATDDTTSGLAFQRATDLQAPRWPDPGRPQQFHLDIMVDDVDHAERQVLALGAERLDAIDRVFADPSGHPFCLIPRPAWAPPITATSRLDPDTGEGQEQPDCSREQQQAHDSSTEREKPEQR